MRVRIGDTYLDDNYEASSLTVGVAAIIEHPDYKKKTVENDIAILELTDRISLTKYPNIKPICLPEAGALFHGEAIVSGWGTLASDSYSPSSLYEVAVTVFPDGDCGKMTPEMTEDMICAGVKEGGRGSCYGDSGGPLVAPDPHHYNSLTLIGLVSWGYGCAEADSLDIYAEVSHFVPWLYEQMPGLRTCPAYK